MPPLPPSDEAILRATEEERRRQVATDALEGADVATDLVAVVLDGTLTAAAEGIGSVGAGAADLLGGLIEGLLDT